MRPARPLALLAVLAWAGCDGSAEAPPPPPREAVNSEVILRAVDAGSGEAISDTALTVRYLVRFPVTLDAAEVEEVPSAQPYSIEHPVSEDSLVLELRLEAPSYERLDTVLSVARGRTAGPFEVALAPRPDRVAAEPAEERPSPAESAPRPAETRPQPAETRPPPQPAPRPTWDRAGVDAGDRAFEAQDWRAAADAYASVSPPASRTGDDARAYQQARVREGMAHINLGEWRAAREALTEVISYDFPEYRGYFYLGQTECALGRYEAGRAALDRIPARRSWGLQPRQRAIVMALVEYQQGVCTFDEARATDDPEAKRRISQRARGQLQGFVQTGLGFSPLPAPLRAAVIDARRRIQELR